MENIIITAKNRRKVERFLLFIFSLYNLTIMFLADAREWGNWLEYLIICEILICWIIHLSKLKDYEFRAKFTVVVMQISILIYAYFMDDILSVLPIFFVFVVLLGVYGIPDLVIISLISAAIIFVWYGFFVCDVTIQSASENMYFVSQMANTFLLQYVVYIWSKRNYEGSKQLLDTLDELKKVESSKDDFVANVSHEIRTPINTICGLSDILLRQELPDKAKENVQNIEMAGKNLMSVVSDILDYSELQSGKIEIEEESYNISTTINDIINMALAQNKEKNLELIVDCDANIPSVLLGDEKKLRRIIMKLVDNAIKFTREGCVCISVSCRKESYGINLAITVKDTGIGMDDVSLEKLFTTYSQVDGSRRREEGGIGLGLAISHALIRKMGGAITVQSKLGRGTIIQCVIPQKVIDDTPMAYIEDRKKINVATYINMEKFSILEIRDMYHEGIVRMAKQLKGKCHICRNLSELQRREQKERFSHIFIGLEEYKENTSYFDTISDMTTVAVVVDKGQENQISNPKLTIVYKPFYILPIVAVLNGSDNPNNDDSLSPFRKFVAPDAHVMVVDDNRMNLRVVAEILKDYQIKVTMANSGKEALDKVSDANYDFIFMDHMMPEMDGVETMKHIRQKVGAYFQKVPIVVLTANAVAGAREMLLEEGFNDFIEKPIERSVLERVLKRNLPIDKIVYGEPENQFEPELPIREELEEEQVEKSAMDEILHKEGLDVSKGILYCNGREQYIKVLQGYCEDSDHYAVQMEQLYENRDWKNYTISIHGLKSALRSVGAVQLGELARLLEYAGKEGRVDYILDHHYEFMANYRSLFVNLRKYDWLYMGSEEENIKEETRIDEKELEDAVFNQIISSMEEAMYSLNQERLTELADMLEFYRYNGHSMSEIAKQAKRKIEKYDFMSAVEQIKIWKKSHTVQ